MKNFLRAFNAYSIEKRLIIMFTLPQICLGISLLYILEEHRVLDLSAIIIFIVMALVLSLYYFVKLNIVAWNPSHQQ